MLHLDTGNTAFMILCASLVMLMTPGLAFFYGGLVGRKNVLDIMMQSFVSMGWTAVLWWLFGFSICLSGDLKSGTDIAGIIGNFDWAFLRGITLSTPSPNDTIPLIVFCAYQMMFAIITPAVITGAFANRVTFNAYMLFLTAWLVIVYFPFVHMVWGGGLLSAWGVKDFAGGIVVHYAVSPTTACLIGAVSGVVDVWDVHGVGGSLGIVMLGIFASTAWNPAASGGVDGLLRGGTHFFLVELGALTIASGWAFLFTLGLLWIIEQITPVKVTLPTEEVGLDEGIHGEKAYMIE